jgi:hypothetical protein
MGIDVAAALLMLHAWIPIARLRCVIPRRPVAVRV